MKRQCERMQQLLPEDLARKAEHVGLECPEL